MTTYFDRASERLDQIDLEKTDALEQLEVWEKEIVFDCLVATQLKGFPSSIAERVYRAVRCWGVESIPNGYELRKPPEGVAGYRFNMNRLLDCLHSIFHDLATLGAPGFNDNPRSGLLGLCGQAKDRMVEFG